MKCRVGKDLAAQLISYPSQDRKPPAILSLSPKFQGMISHKGTYSILRQFDSVVSCSLF